MGDMLMMGNSHNKSMSCAGTFEAPLPRFTCLPTVLEYASLALPMAMTSPTHTSGVHSRMPLQSWVKHHSSKEEALLFHATERDLLLATPRFRANLCFWCGRSIQARTDRETLRGRKACTKSSVNLQITFLNEMAHLHSGSSLTNSLTS